MASPHHEPPDLPGFRHRRLIGAGGSSDVFLYEWVEEKVNVAVKVWNDRLGAEDHDALAKETKEVAELAAHPYVLPLHAVGVTDDDRSFVVMDYRAGGDLETRSQRVSVEDALNITIKVAGALDVAARHGILHGDVKPVNILLTSGGEPQIVGFGSLSSAGRPGGPNSSSLPWMAPEVLADPPEPSAWADIWSLAATCYTLLAGRTPFEAPDGSDAPGTLLERIREYEPLALDRDDVPASLEGTLRKAMFKRRAGRHWSAADFAKALQAVEEELGLPVTPLADMPERGAEVPEVAEVLEGSEIAEVPEIAEVAPDPVLSPAGSLEAGSLEAGDTAEVPIVTGPVADSVVAPDGNDDDVLGHRVDVDRVARLLASPHTQLPVSVAVQGLPGSGRSTFLRKIEERIDALVEHDDAYSVRTRHIRIDARRHADGDVASGVLDSVRSVGKNAPPPLVTKHQAAQRRAAELRAALAGLPEEDGHRGKRRAQHQPMTTTMALTAMDREVAAYEAALRAAPPGPPPGPPAGAQPGLSAVRTIVYVDDLDRCDPATTAGVLQAIDELSSQDGFAVVAAVDAQTLQRSLQGRVAEPAAYLSRVFDVPFALRAFAGDPAVRFMRSLMRQAVPSWPAALAARGAGERSGRTVASFEMSPGEALFTSELARFCATPGGARKLLAVYRLARTAPVPNVNADPAGHHALGVLMAILVGAPAQAVQVLGAVVEALAAGEDGGTFRTLVEKVAREHTAECGRATCGSCADWSRVIRAYADLVRGQQVPPEVGAYAAWVDEVARFSFPT